MLYEKIITGYSRCKKENKDADQSTEHRNKRVFKFGPFWVLIKLSLAYLEKENTIKLALTLIFNRVPRLVGENIAN